MDEETKEVQETKNEKEEKIGFNITALIFGIISLFIANFIPILPFITGTVAIIFGVMGMKKGGKYLGIAGLICSIIAIFIQIGTIYSFFILYTHPIDIPSKVKDNYSNIVQNQIEYQQYINDLYSSYIN